MQRSALQTGLDIEANVGVNPDKFGMIGSADAHTGLATVDEDNFWGKLGASEPSPYRASTQAQYSSSGYAAVWAISFLLYARIESALDITPSICHFCW